MNTEKINNIKIKPFLNDDKRPILHEDIINNPHPIILIAGKKGSGKWWLIYEILKQSINKHNPGCNIYIFCSWVNRDPIYKQISTYWWKYIKIHMYEDFIINNVNV